MKKLNRKDQKLENKLPIKIIQFGEGNFLRAFVDYAFQQLNKEINFQAGIAVIQPIENGLINMLNEQDGLYTLFLRGVKGGKEIQDKELISNIVKGINPYTNYNDYLNLAKEKDLEFVISNTTEAGIAYVETDKPEMSPPSSFPAKLTVLLHERYKYFNGDSDKGLTIIPCELINYNSDKLKEIILKYTKAWDFGEAFEKWILDHNYFHNTLVDRIVPGYPRDEIETYNAQLEYKDNLIVSAEPFFLWVIEGDNTLKEKLPFHKTVLNVQIVKDMQPYRTRKVRILNGAHTAMVPFSLLFGNTTVKETIEDDFTGKFVQKAVFDEIVETLEMDKNELNEFAEEVFDRFRNPFVKHQLASIALNSIAKFKVRVLPSLLEYHRLNNKLPIHLTYAFACLIRFYKGTWQGNNLPLNDSDDIINTFIEIWETNDFKKIVFDVLKNPNFWDRDLSKIEGLITTIAMALEEIEIHGIEKGFVNFKNKIL